MRTRGAEGESFVEVDFELEDSDRALLADVDPGQKTAWWTIRRESAGVSARSYPPLKRPLEVRNGLGAALGRLYVSDLLERFQSSGDFVVDVEYRRVLEALASNQEYLSDQQFAAIRRFASVILDAFVGGGHAVSDELKELLGKLRAYVETAHPKDLLEARLLEICPQFVVFSEDQRELYSRYLIRNVVAGAPPSLSNLASVAGIDIADLGDAVEKKDWTRRRSLIKRANRNLEQALEQSWEGRRFVPDIDVADDTLLIHLGNVMEEMTSVEERSEGLRLFLSLKLFFLSEEGGSNSVVIIDEIERHLHYDAQAAVVDMLYGLRETSGVLYSTHSIGSLPRDLGSGIAVASPIEGSDHSKIVGSIWSNGVSGMSTLLTSMGAGMVSLLPSRFVLVVEGDCDAILYPRLFREALGFRDLPFRIVPGLASLDSSLYRSVQTDAGRLAFLVDGDGDGDKYRSRLEEAGVSSDAIFGIGSIHESLVLEDLVDAHAYKDAIGKAFRIYGKSPSVPDAVITRPNRPEKLKAWCLGQRLKEPQKRQVAVYLAESQGSPNSERDEPILDPEFRSQFVKIAHAIMEWLQ